MLDKLLLNTIYDLLGDPAYQVAKKNWQVKLLYLGQRQTLKQILTHDTILSTYLDDPTTQHARVVRRHLQRLIHLSIDETLFGKSTPAVSINPQAYSEAEVISFIATNETDITLIVTQMNKWVRYLNSQVVKTIGKDHYTVELRFQRTNKWVKAVHTLTKQGLALQAIKTLRPLSKYVNTFIPSETKNWLPTYKRK